MNLRPIFNRLADKAGAIGRQLRRNGLVEYSDGSKSWYRNEKLHRDKGPAVETADGSKFWFRDGKPNRDGGPAVESVGGSKQWYRDVKPHRVDGPAIETPNGTKFWFREGKLHRENGPAVEYPDGSKFWFRDDELHRDDGPAVEGFAGHKEWWLNGKQGTQTEVERIHSSQIKPGAGQSAIRHPSTASTSGLARTGCGRGGRQLSTRISAVPRWDHRA